MTLIIDKNCTLYVLIYIEVSICLQLINPIILITIKVLCHHPEKKYVLAMRISSSP